MGEVLQATKANATQAHSVFLALPCLESRLEEGSQSLDVSPLSERLLQSPQGIIELVFEVNFAVFTIVRSLL